MIRAETSELNAELLRQAFSCFPSGVTAICSLIDGAPAGMATSSFTSVSLDPPVVLVCVARGLGHLEAAAGGRAHRPRMRPQCRAVGVPSERLPPAGRGINLGSGSLTLRLRVQPLPDDTGR
jgi:hypothetical protein